jgi:CHAT domain
VKRTMIGFFPVDGQESGDFFLLEEPHDPPPPLSPRLLRSLNCDPAAAAFSASADPRAAGELLFADLSSHPTVAWALAEARRQASAGAEQTLVLHLDREASVAHHLPWECLCAGGEFLGLTPELPIVRVIEGRGHALAPVWDPPLRFLIVIGAAGISGLAEWQTLRRILLSPSRPFEVAIHLLVAEPELVAELEAAPDPALSWSYLTLDELALRIEVFRPHVLHVSGHGIADDAGCFLELTSRIDWIKLNSGAALRGSIILEASDFRDWLRRHPALWLTCLSCCDSGRPTSSSRALAASLVAAGFPAVVGMRAPVEARDATLFAEAFYRELVERLGRAAAVTYLDFEIAAAVAAGRRALSKQRVAARGQAPGDCAWSLPVLYARPTPLLLHRSTLAFLDTVRLQAEIAALDQFRGDLALLPEFPAAKLAALDTRVATLRAALLGA